MIIGKKLSVTFHFEVTVDAAENIPVIVSGWHRLKDRSHSDAKASRAGWIIYGFRFVSA